MIMTMGVDRGRAQIPVWTAVAVIISILLAVGGVTFGAVSKAADADHRMLSMQIDAAAQAGADRENRLRALEQGMAAIKAQYEKLEEQNQRILAALNALEAKVR